MKTVKEIYDFFQQGVETASKDLTQLVSSDADFIVKDENGRNVGANMSLAAEYYKICEKMVVDGLLIRLPRIGDLHYMGYVYVSLNTSDVKQRTWLNREFSYGSFDCKYRGFTYIRDTYKDSVVAIEGIKPIGDPDMGTAYYIGNNRFVIAAHCIICMPKFNLLLPDGSRLKLKEIWFAANEDPQTFDIAVIVVDGELSFRPLKMEDPSVLDDVLVMGYPFIPGLNPIQLAEKASVATYVKEIQKSATGQVLGESREFLSKMDSFLINARVKGGNSGSPVINNCGKVIGSVVQIPFDDQDGSKTGRYDIMGYGICFPSKYTNQLIQSHDVWALSESDGYYQIVNSILNFNLILW